MGKDENELMDAIKKKYSVEGACPGMDTTACLDCEVNELCRRVWPFYGHAPDDENESDASDNEETPDLTKEEIETLLGREKAEYEEYYAGLHRGEEFVNLTPHEINLPGITLSPNGEVARVASSTRLVEVVSGIDLYETEYGETTGLPPQIDGIYLVVSALVRIANPSRSDLYSPGELIRDENGKITGCRGLTR